MENKCLNCSKPVKNKYCNVSCQNVHQCTGRKNSQESIEKMKITRAAKWKIFDVTCHICKTKFNIKEYLVEKPSKEKYFCTRKCACTYSSNVNKDERIRKVSETAKNSEKVMLANKISGEKRKGFYYGGGKKKPIESSVTICLYCGDEIKHKINKKRKYHKECWLKCSGGIKQGSSRGKHGWYKGYWCDSSYELAWVIYNLEHNIKFERNHDGFEYIFEGKKRKYYPDFIVENEYIEIKNFRSDITDAKIKAFPEKIKVYYKEYIKKNILPYVIEKYGKNFIELYEEKI